MRLEAEKGDTKLDKESNHEIEEWLNISMEEEFQSVELLMLSEMSTKEMGFFEQLIL